MTSVRPTGREQRGALLAVASAAAFGLAGPFSKAVLVTGALSPLRLAQLRITGAAVILLVWVAGRRAAGRGTRHRWTPADIGLVAVYGTLAFAAVQTFYFVAIDHLPVGVALLLEYLSVVLVALFAAIWQRRSQPRAVWLGVALVLTGLVVMTEPWRSFRLDVVGVLAGGGAAIASASYFLIGEHATARLPPLELIAASAAAAALGMGIALPWWTFPFRRLSDPGRLLSRDVPLWLLVAAVVIVGTVLAYALGLSALANLAAPTATVLSTLEIVVAAAASWALVGEHLDSPELIGGAVIFAGVAVVGQRSRLGADSPEQGSGHDRTKVTTGSAPPDR